MLSAPRNAFQAICEPTLSEIFSMLRVHHIRTVTWSLVKSVGGQLRVPPVRTNCLNFVHELWRGAYRTRLRGRSWRGLEKKWRTAKLKMYEQIENGRILVLYRVCACQLGKPFVKIWSRLPLALMGNATWTRKKHWKAFRKGEWRPANPRSVKMACYQLRTWKLDGRGKCIKW